MDGNLREICNSHSIQAVIRDVFAICRRLRLKAALIGAAAVDAWGHARASLDLDFLVDFKATDLPHIGEAAAAAGGDIDRDWQRENREEDRMIRLRLRGVQVDMLCPMLPSAHSALAKRKRRRCYGILAWVVPVEELLIMKLQVGRPRDVDDAIALVVANPQLLRSPSLLKEVRRLHLGREWRLVRASASGQTG